MKKLPLLLPAAQTKANNTKKQLSIAPTSSATSLTSASTAVISLLTSGLFAMALRRLSVPRTRHIIGACDLRRASGMSMYLHSFSFTLQTCRCLHGITFGDPPEGALKTRLVPLCSKAWDGWATLWRQVPSNLVLPSTRLWQSYLVQGSPEHPKIISLQ